MDQQDRHVEQIRTQGILPLFYHDDEDICLSIVAALYTAGIRIVEFTNRGPKAAANFEAIIRTRDVKWKDLLIAAGTIRTAEQASRFISIGADFLVSPVFDADIADIAYLNKMLWIPGCMTPTEIHVADKAGCRLIKLFPGNILTHAFMSGIRELFPGIHFMPTGGVELNKENITGWFNAGVCAIGMGSKLISPELIAKKDFETLTRLTREVMAMIPASRK